MNFLKIIIIFNFLNLISFKLLSNERYICSRDSTNEVLNFYVSDSKLYLSGLSISGTYNILNYNYKSGVLAINMSKIGNDSGLELVFLDFIKKSFSIKSNISAKTNKSIIEINGNCDKINK